MPGKLKRQRVRDTGRDEGLFGDLPETGIVIQKPTAKQPALRVYRSSKRALDNRLSDKLGIINADDRAFSLLAGDVHNLSNKVVCGDAAAVLSQLPGESIRCVVTSPPYWNVVDYGMDGQYGQVSYEEYVDQLLSVWVQCARLLKPNGKLCINVPLMPIAKAVINKQHTRHLKNLCQDIEHSILSHCPTMHRFSLYIWQKQTTEKMFGSYPYPPNLYEQNTVEFIAVLVKDGKPDVIPADIKEASRLSEKEWMNLTKQIWRLYPEDVKRSRHPAPYPVSLPSRLIAMYSFARVAKGRIAYPGDIILDPFVGTGATCIAAKELGRNYIGIDLVPDFCVDAVRRIDRAVFTGKVRLAELGDKKNASTRSRSKQSDLLLL